jgi:hypothetical protein
MMSCPGPREPKFGSSDRVADISAKPALGLLRARQVGKIGAMAVARVGADLHLPDFVSDPFCSFPTT